MVSGPTAQERAEKLNAGAFSLSLCSQFSSRRSVLSQYFPAVGAHRSTNTRLRPISHFPLTPVRLFRMVSVTGIGPACRKTGQEWISLVSLNYFMENEYENRQLAWEPEKEIQQLHHRRTFLHHGTEARSRIEDIHPERPPFPRLPGMHGLQNRARQVRCRRRSDRSPEAVRETDILVLASPVYYWDVSSQMKAFVDRTFSFLVPDFLTNPIKSRLKPGKKLVLILAQNNPDKDSFTNIFPKFDYFFRAYGFTDTRLIRALGFRHRGGREPLGCTGTGGTNRKGNVGTQLAPAAPPGRAPGWFPHEAAVDTQVAHASLRIIRTITFRFAVHAKIRQTTEVRTPGRGTDPKPCRPSAHSKCSNFSRS